MGMEDSMEQPDGNPVDDCLKYCQKMQLTPDQMKELAARLEGETEQEENGEPTDMVTDDVTEG